MSTLKERLTALLKIEMALSRLNLPRPFEMAADYQIKLFDENQTHSEAKKCIRVEGD
jgi:hypothetical protein